MAWSVWALADEREADFQRCRPAVQSPLVAGPALVRTWLRPVRSARRMTAAVRTRRSPSVRPSDRCTSGPAARLPIDVVWIIESEWAKDSVGQLRRVTADPCATHAILNSSPRSYQSPSRRALDGGHQLPVIRAPVRGASSGALLNSHFSRGGNAPLRQSLWQPPRVETRVPAHPPRCGIAAVDVRHSPGFDWQFSQHPVNSVVCMSCVGVW